MFSYSFMLRKMCMICDPNSEFYTTPELIEEIWCCESITYIPDLSKCIALTCLRCYKCVLLTHPPDVSKCVQLFTLDFDYCISLLYLPDVSKCVRFHYLSCSNCPLLTCLPNLSNCILFRELNCSNCPLLTYIPDLSKCIYFYFLGFGNCRLITQFPKFPPQRVGTRTIITSQYNCPWLKDRNNSCFAYNLKQAIKIQRFIKKWLYNKKLKHRKSITTTLSRVLPMDISSLVSLYCI